MLIFLIITLLILFIINYSNYLLYNEYVLPAAVVRSYNVVSVSDNGFKSADFDLIGSFMR